MQKFDVIVIGSGSAGKNVATKVIEAGKTVAVIDKQPFGGTCSQRGCDPKKLLVGAAEVVARFGQLTDKGLTGSVAIDWPELIHYKRTFTDPIPDRTEKKFTEAGIAIFHGAASFVSPNAVTVDGTELQAEYIVIAAGAHPRPLGIPGETLLIDSTAFLALERLPERLVLVGGGYIAFEFAHIAARAGAKVTIVHQGKSPLKEFDPDLVDLLVKATESLGIEVLLEAKVTRVEGALGALSVGVSQGGKTKTIGAQVVVHAAGRPPDLADLALEKAGVDFDENGVLVDEFMQSRSNPAVYACGDAAAKGLPLTPVASYDSGIVADTILKGRQRAYTESAVPSVVFTTPPLASVGLTEARAKAKGQPVTVYFAETTDWYSSRRTNELVSGYKMLVDPATGLIVGAHLLGSGSDEVINILTLAINHRIPAETLRRTLFAYPTHGSDLAYMFG